MIGQASLIETLKALPPEKLHRELRQVINPTLQDLVAALERGAAMTGQTLRSCVIDDYRISRVEVGETECRVVLTFTASAQWGPGARGRLIRISGSARAVIDDAAQVHYSGTTFAQDQVFVAPDVGVGD